MTRIHDHGQDDAIPYELGSWAPVAGKVREHLERATGHEMTQIELPQTRGAANVVALPVNRLSRQQTREAIARNEARIDALVGWIIDGDDAA